MTKQLRTVLIGLTLVLFAAHSALATEKASNRLTFVAGGKAEDVLVVGKEWTAGEGYLECSGMNNYLFAGKGLGKGDVHIRARLALLKVAGSAASVMIDSRDNLGFDGASQEGTFASGSILGRQKPTGRWTDYLEEGKPFELEVIREGSRLSIQIDGKPVWQGTDRRGEFGTIALRPWRATMRVYEFSASGVPQKAIISAEVRLGKNKAFSIPAFDLSRETDRQVVIAQGTATEYKGHPTTLLLPDGKTMFCVYPLGHGGPGAVLRRSNDGGLTWSEPLDVPDNWRQSNNCPALFRLAGPDGKARLFVFEGHGEMRQAVSEDDGRTWSPMKKNGLKTVMPFTTIIRLKDGRLLGGWNWQISTWFSFSDDGGLTWSPQQCLAEANEEFPSVHPCEPAFIRSPDGNEIACLMRENSRRFMSLVSFSRDEGKTWTKIRELPRALTGDRHQPCYSADGRLVIPFRDMAPASPTHGHFVAWIGTYDDIAQNRPGQYRVKLLHSYAGSDCGYPGLERLPDGTFVATTYIKYRPGEEKQSVVSTRFKLSEIDAMAAKEARLKTEGLKD